MSTSCSRQTGLPDVSPQSTHIFTAAMGQGVTPPRGAHKVRIPAGQDFRRPDDKGSEETGGGRVRALRAWAWTRAAGSAAPALSPVEGDRACRRM
jgi:hypothetical protein